MKISRHQLQQAVEQGIISAEQARRLEEWAAGHSPGTPSFTLTNVLYYLGGLLAIGAMTLFMSLGWEAFGGFALLAIACAYAGAGLVLVEFFRRRNLAVPAGICAVFVVALTPMAVYGLLKGMGWWMNGLSYRDYHYLIRWNWVVMELATLAVGSIMAWRYRYPFLLMPIGATLWYMSMDLADMLGGGQWNFRYGAWVSVWFGLVHLLLALWVDIRSRRSLDYAFWLYLFGVLTFWGGLSSMQPSGEWSRLVYLLINILLVGAGVALVRRVFVIFGGLGISLYLGHLAFEIFQDSWFFPFALTLIGLALVGAGIWWQRNEERIGQQVEGLLPGPLRETLARRKC